MQQYTVVLKDAHKKYFGLRLEYIDIIEKNHEEASNSNKWEEVINSAAYLHSLLREKLISIRDTEYQ